MTERLKRLQGMAERYNKLGAVSDETVERVNARLKARQLRDRLPKLRQMDGAQIKNVRTRYGLSQSDLAETLGMSVESVSKWERNESQPGNAALRILNTIEVKGPEVFADMA
ncbi:MULTISPECIES: DNA-binding transcriptional regulator [unclassified Erwinia]|uniref:helix-turn-helix domain-containing protein n=1 Tax=unclassified Erwinia TaxID=2622719 RepID=UPI000701BDE9|nr:MULTISPECIES: helix-turn-helix domain-containing protein [unclassified Erwinia]KQN57455.1 transcriptional regulator, XRE family protein [Erwinia sp. Leaf53]PLV57827.1 transcriptional regulator, XRE family protein [Erwinia sp. B116]